MESPAADHGTNSASQSPQTQQVAVPNDADADKISQLLMLSMQVATATTGEAFDGSRADLERLQQVFDSNTLDAGNTLVLQSLGMTFGQVLANDDDDYDWWMVDDADGRDPCLRYKETDLLVFPQTFLSKRVEQGETIDIANLYHGLVQQLERAKDHHFGA